MNLTNSIYLFDGDDEYNGDCYFILVVVVCIGIDVWNSNNMGIY